MGVGDHHDHKYDHLSLPSKLTELGEFAVRESIYSGARLDAEFCPFTLHVYPSDEMKAAHTTNNPIIYTAISVLIFAFTSMVFLLYDRTVERRQRSVMKTAVESSAIVSSLFPATVRNRLFPAESTSREPGKGRLQLFLEGDQSCSRDNDFSERNVLTGSPIAELYPETTVFFADVAGFTAWSSARQPTEVFHLLESIYGAFDKLAKRRGVFKVETIGDSYVAVIGLPTPRRHHAAVMAKFAAECQQTMAKVTSALETTLGPVSSPVHREDNFWRLISLTLHAQGTADLALRIGLNSGPTTAGVLRGDKARFQLFGDVRTCSYSDRFLRQVDPQSSLSKLRFRR
jgi:class 3 adenylate cyclase